METEPKDKTHEIPEGTSRDLVTAAVAKEAGITVYLMEELTDARLRCEQLKKFVAQAVRLVSKSSHRDHFYEVAGDVIYGLPDSLFKLDKALAATALAASRLDYEELKAQLKPEKVEELEDVLRNVRLRQIDRRAPFIQPAPEGPPAPQGKTASMFKAASKSRVSDALRRIAAEVEAARIPPKEASLRLNRIKMALSQTAQEAIEAMGETQAGSREDVMKGFKSANPDLTDDQLEEIADQWEKNKDVVKDKQAARYSGDPVWIKAKHPGTTDDGTPFRKGGEVLYWPWTKTFMVGAKAKAAYAQFSAEIADEAMYNGYVVYLTSGAHAKVWNLDESLVGTPDYMGLAYFWSYHYKFVMRETSALQRVKVHEAFLKAGLKVDEDSPAHAEIIHKLLGVSMRELTAASEQVADDKQSRFEEGKPADPTKNMSPEDAKEWKDQNEKNKDNFKSAGEAEEKRIDRLTQSIEGDLESFKSAWKKYTSDPGKFAPQLENAKRDLTAIGTAVRTATRTLEGMSKSASIHPLRHFVRMARMKLATVNDEDTLMGLLEMEIENIDGGRSEASLNSDIKSAAKAFDSAVEKVLHDWSKKNLDKFDLGKGPLRSATDADDVVSVMMDLRGGAGYLYFMEAEGHGVGTWDGDWDPLFKESDKTLKELSALVKSKTHSQYQKLKTALEERAYELAEPEEEE